MAESFSERVSDKLAHIFFSGKEKNQDGRING
jgi:hypothetical protein